MRHGKSGRQFSRKTGHRELMLRNLLASLIEHEQIQTTVAKAKELRMLADQAITLGKRGDIHARRQAFSLLQNNGSVHKLFTDLAERNRNRPGGYTRVLKTGYRLGDGAPMSIIEWVERAQS